MTAARVKVLNLFLLNPEKSIVQSNLALRTPHYYGQFALSLGKESPYIFFTFNPLNTDTPLIRPPPPTPSESVLTGFDCTMQNFY